jgi:GT2 family glycosyltransferase
MADAAAAFQRGHLADALAIAEGLVRHYGSASPAPAALRARVLQACGSPLAPRAWDAAWSCDPENTALQDAMLQAWTSAHSGRTVAALGATFLPMRCREGTEQSLLKLLRQCGVSRIGACWREGTRIAIRCFDSDAPAGNTARLVLANEDDEQTITAPLDGTLVQVDVAPDARPWSVAFEADARILQGSPIVFDPPAPSPARRSQTNERAIDVIIPVYKDRAAVRTCIKSVLASLPQNKSRTRVIVVDDASPDAAIATWLDGLARSGWITLLRNRFNLGFIEAVNRALRQSETNDALLLNSDTEVFGDWVDRLASSLDGDDRVASVMPWSNNGEIGNLWSAADTRNAPPSETARQIDDCATGLVRQGRLKDLEIPTCSGFAMLVRREALRQVGLLDGAALSRGYLEEVDWCLRARAAGWRHRLAAGVFVTHNGSTSFGAEKVLRVRQNRSVIAARYPEHAAEYASFMASAPLARARQQVLRALPWKEPAATQPHRTGAFAPLASSCHRIAVRLDPSSPSESRRLLQHARELCADPASTTRLLVFGRASEALRHTGVVDVVEPDTGLGPRLRLLSDEDLMRLCGCEASEGLF